MRPRWSNRRGKLHGIVALRRVLDSATLRRMALHAMSDDELAAEVARRQARRVQARVRARLLGALVASAMAFVREVGRE